MTDQQTERRIQSIIAVELSATDSQIQSATAMLDEGSTVPFIARYRKEATGGLSDTQLRALENRLLYLREMEARRSTIIQSIEEQGKMDTGLASKLTNATTKSELEDLYLPYKQKRKTKGLIAREAGIEPLADLLWNNPENAPDVAAEKFLNKDQGFEDVTAVLNGAKYILMERFAVDATLISRLRTLLNDEAWFCSAVMTGKETEGEKFQNYFDYQEKLTTIPSHRVLAMFRGRSEGMLSLSLNLKQADGSFGTEECQNIIANHTGYAPSEKAADAWCKGVVDWTWKIKLASHLETDFFIALREKAETEAIRVFSENLKDLLLAAPAGSRTTLGLDPGYRSGVKCAITDKTGKVLAFETIYPHAPQKRWDQALHTICSLCTKHNVELLAIGNGTASRETDTFAAEVIKVLKNPNMSKVVVSEAGASVYSASEIAEQEFPELDVTIRGAVSIARRLQDPLAELVKIEPKALGVGQYQHDVSQTALARSLDATVEDCVNSVGVDVNTASAALLKHIAGISQTIAENIVSHRDQHGSFVERKQLGKVARLGPKAYEQCAGFLRIANGSNMLDASGVHPEAYPLVEKITAVSSTSLDQLIGDTSKLRAINAADFTDDKFGLPTVRDILSELEKPGRDPRPEFQTAKFDDSVETMKDLKLNQVLEGQVTNVTNFGAFVDVGVHQDGLVHIASMSDRFIKDPREVVKTGDIVKVKVMSVSIERKRISLSMRLTDDANEVADSNNSRPKERTGDQKRGSNQNAGKNAPTRNRSKAAESGNNQRRSKTSYSTKTSSGGDNQPSALALALQASLEKAK